MGKRAAIWHASNSAATGPDSLSAAELKREDICLLLHDALCQFWNTGAIPRHWTDSTLIALDKPGGGVRGISLLQALYKVLANLILGRLVGQPLLRSQTGFAPGRSTIHGIRAAQAFIDACRTSINTTGYMTFVDLEKAFDCINRNALGLGNIKRR